MQPIISMTLRGVLFTTLIVAIPSTTLRADETKTAGDTQYQVAVGGQSVSGDDGRGAARLNEHRDVQDGLTLDSLQILLQPDSSPWSISLTARDVSQDDQRLHFVASRPGLIKIRTNYVELPHTYSTGSKTLWSGGGSGTLTIADSFRQDAELAAGAPTAPLASPALGTLIRSALRDVDPFDLAVQRKELDGSIELLCPKGFTLLAYGRRSDQDGSKPLGFGTYVRRQALSGIPGTGAGQFWRETIEARGMELIEPVDWSTTDFGATVSWANKLLTTSAGWMGSRFRNGTTSLFFDNPFEGSPGRASATTFNPTSDQEPAAPFGNNNFRGLFSRSSVQLWPENDYSRLFADIGLRLPGKTRINASFAKGTFEQDDPFQPYATNDQVVFSGIAGDPGVVLAKDAPLPQDSLDGELKTTQVDLGITSRPVKALALRAHWRSYELDDERPEIQFPGYSSSGDSFFRRGIGQRDADNNRVLFNEIGGYTRERLDFGAAYTVGAVTFDAEYATTDWDYDNRQVKSTSDDTVRGSIRLALSEAELRAWYSTSDREFDGSYSVGLETSGVRSFDLWNRERDQYGLDIAIPMGEHIQFWIAGSRAEDQYPGAVEGFDYGYGLQSSKSSSWSAGVSGDNEGWRFGLWAGIEGYDWNSLQVTKSSLTTDYNPINRWSRASDDNVTWFGAEVEVPLAAKVTLRANVDSQHFDGTWSTTNLDAPDINSAIAYKYPGLSDDTLSARVALLWQVSPHVGIEGSLWKERFELVDFTTDSLQPYIQGIWEQTQSSPSDIGDANVSRMLLLDSRLDDYDVTVLSALVHLSF